MTQLVGRILRQPHADKTGVAALDECHVVCHHVDTGAVINAIKAGLEEDGMGDLVKQIVPAEGDGTGGKKSRTVPRREKFRGIEIYLPRVLRIEGTAARPLDYEQDVLFSLDWASLDPTPLADKIPANAHAAETQLKRIRLGDDGGELIIDEDVGHTPEAQRFDPAYAVRMIADVVFNPWVGREIVGSLVAALRSNGFDDAKLGALSGLIVEKLRQWLIEQRDAMAETLFRAEVAAGRIQFRLRTDGENWRMPHDMLTDQPDTARQLLRKSGGLLEKSLFAPIYEADFTSQDERDIAVYLDEDKALSWWHRNVARAGQFHVQGWRKDKVYPDLIFALRRDDKSDRLVVLEMKGEHLSGNPDTEYKNDLLRLVSEAYRFEQITEAGRLELVMEAGTTVESDLVLMPDWPTRIPGEFLTN